MRIRLEGLGLKVCQQVPLNVWFDEQVVGQFIADLIVDDKLLIELKAAENLDSAHVSQCLNYLKATRLPLCLLINFGKPRVQVKRIHEYKRQLLNLLHVCWVYRNLKEDPTFLPQPRVVVFAGKAAPGYERAKDVIKAINSVADIVNADPDAQDRLRVLFIPDYGITNAERIIPAADLSEQISLAGTEASGTGNMKFCLNGALTIGTRDGANIEIAEEVGEENMFLFGLSASEVAESESWYDPCWHLDHEPRVRSAVDFLLGETFAWKDPAVFARLGEMLIGEGDRWRHLGDMGSYLDAQAAADTLFATPDEWCRTTVLNTARGGRFSSDRAIREYAEQIWKVKPVRTGLTANHGLPTGD